MTTAPITLAIHAVGRDRRAELAEDVRRGLGGAAKRLPPRWFYDERGCELFEEITALPEYYQTRTESSILQACAGRVMDAARPSSVVELGAGSCTKTRILLDAARRAGVLERFVPFDVSDAAVQAAARDLVEDYPGLTVYGVVGDFAAHLHAIPRFGRQLVVFLGGTIGNFDDPERDAFLAAVRSLLEPGDTFLLGVDLVKDAAELVRAYDDAAGVTAAFNRNVLAVINRELGATFDLDSFDHVARWDAGLRRIEMHLRSRCEQEVDIPGGGITVRFAAGESILTEISAKYTRDTVADCFRRAALRLLDWHTDPHERFAVALAGPAGGGVSLAGVPTLG